MGALLFVFAALHALRDPGALRFHARSSPMKLRFGFSKPRKSGRDTKADGFLISEDLDQTTNSLDLQADRKAYGSAAVRVCSLACSPRSRSSAVSCKEFPDEEHGGDGSDHEFSSESASSHDSSFKNFGSSVSKGMNRPSSNVEYYDVVVKQKNKSEKIGKFCMTKRKKEPNEGNADLRSSKYHRSSVPTETTHPQLSSCALNEDEKKSKRPRKMEEGELERDPEAEIALTSEPKPNLEPELDPKLKTGSKAESFPEREDKLVEEKHFESDNGQREVESENLDQVQKGSVVVEAELLDKSMNVAKEREACSDDGGLSESQDVSIDLENCTKDERDVVADEGDKLEDSLVGEREQGNGMDDKNSLKSSVQLDDKCKKSKGIDQEVKTKNFDVSHKEVEKEMSDGETLLKILGWQKLQKNKKKQKNEWKDCSRRRR
ncbi:uncharacterized protein LOC111462020 [Cucurbita moschata]|uniref:Uncharacterized protein LOC111462020 n=1 Tax=Cucurbita moschata TaxID=3662 RepID=A0A6J1HBU0_CUCMO|nr:uncharacterized protein LOC111462020 [Cucurbita moschata]